MRDKLPREKLSRLSSEAGRHAGGGMEPTMQFLVALVYSCSPHLYFNLWILLPLASSLSVQPA